MRILFYLLCLTALVRITGADLAIMQIEAWSKMIYERSELGIENAVQSTFSGKAPCEKCLSIQEEREEREESSEKLLLSLDKLKLPLPTQRLNPAPRYSLSLSYSFLPPPTLSSLHFQEVLSPPPQVG